MSRIDETEISKAIIGSYYKKLTDHIVSDVIIAGAGPAGLTAAYYLALKGYKITLLEKRLSPGGGIWGGGMGMNEVVVQAEVLPMLDEFGIRHMPVQGELHTVDAVELAAGLCLIALQAGAAIFNLITVEDVSVQEGRVTGVVANRTMISGALHVDPITFSAKAILDGTGHEAVLVGYLRKRRLIAGSTEKKYIGEGPMDATLGEAFVVEKAAEAYPGLWVSGMSVSATFGGPRMGPIFGGMLLSGWRVAGLIADAIS
jgi:sulfide-dependent adenosine diphosphate thiazole synthase